MHCFPFFHSDNGLRIPAAPVKTRHLTGYIMA